MSFIWNKQNDFIWYYMKFYMQFILYEILYVYFIIWKTFFEIFHNVSTYVSSFLILSIAQNTCSFVQVLNFNVGHNVYIKLRAPLHFFV